jgi:hypothetical protein
MQTIDADIYRNQKVRLSVYVRTKEVERVNLYFNVVGTETLLAFANIIIEPAEEIMDWTLNRITLDVKEESVFFSLGVVLYGWGTLWLDDFNLEIVDKSVPSDDMIISRKVSQVRKALEKRNFSFNKVAMNFGFED